MTSETRGPAAHGRLRLMAAADTQRDFFGTRARSFASPGHGERRIGVIDAGSNSVRLVVFEGNQRSPAVVHNEKVMCALGAELHETGRLHPGGAVRAMAALRRFAALAEHLDVGALVGVATAAIREAEDGREFRNAVERETGIRLRIASGAEEARLAAQGVLFGNPAASGIVVDLGGASMELCAVSGGRTGPGASTRLGPLRLRALDGAKAIRAAIARELEGIDAALAEHGHRMYLVGGSWRAMAKLQMDRANHPLRVLHEYTLTPEEALDLGRWVAGVAPADLAEINGISDARAPVLPYVGHLLAGLVEGLEPREVVVSAFGLREGVCYETMPAPLRRQDPLIAAAIDQENRRARHPGFGADLADWMQRVLPPVDEAEARLMRAASHLADVNWRTHPDYRVQGCWETVTRVALTDIGHRDRVILGAALSYRHKRGRKALAGVDAMRLISEAEHKRAEQIGYALRLGIEIAAATPGILDSVAVEQGEDEITLTLGGASAELSGEEVDRRLAQFAKTVGKDASIVAG